jgi:phospholipid/cholesterol/gamma-HCH transport system substrate-binding protein
MHIRVWTTGLFIVLGFALFTGILFLVGSRQNLFAKHIDVYAEFSNLGGLGNGAKVRVDGLDAGQVKRIEAPPSPSGKFRLELQISDKLRGMVRTDSIASIETEGVVGDKYISITKGSDRAPEAGPATTLRGKETPDIAALLDKGSGVLSDLDDTIKDLRGHADLTLNTMTKTLRDADGIVVGLKPQIDKIAGDGVQIANNLNLLVSDLQNGKGPAGLLLKDEQARKQIQDTLANVKQLSANLEQASDRVNGLVADFQSRNLAARVEAVLQNAQEISSRLNGTLNEALGNDRLGENGAQNIRSTLSNLNQATSNLQDDTEALKHNFFLRGFFKRRGYFNMSQLTREDYLQEKGLQKHISKRLWLRASEVFETGSDGNQQLTPAGCREIDTEIGPVVDILPYDTIVVEGYAMRGSPTQQFITSRERAELVRRYLEEHFDFNHKNLGIVAMRNEPPKATGIDDWDGVAIALVSAPR